MISTYLKIATRNFLKEKFYSTLNIFGLAIGISACLLITLFVVHEAQYDRFHVKADRIARIAMHLDIGGNAADLNATFPALAHALKQDLPEVEDAARLYMLNGRIFKKDDLVFSEDEVLYADSSFFRMFDFPLMSGNPSRALSKPNQVLLTPELLEKYFPGTGVQDVIGENLTIQQQVYEVTGVIKPAPASSHFHYKAVVSMLSSELARDNAWDNMNLSTYVLLRDRASVATLKDKLPTLFSTHIPNYDKFPSNGIAMEPIIQPLTDIHLHSNVQGEFEPPGSMTTIYVFGSVALIVLVLASVNFINLITARSANRTKEVGVRKVLGSSVAMLRRQFIMESILLVAVSTLLALGLVELLRTPFILISGRALPFDLLLKPFSIALLVLFIVVTGILAGSYPAFFLAAFKPVDVLKGRLRAGFRSGRLRNILVGFQFCISIVLISCTLVVQRQLDYMRSRKLGFDKENVIVVDHASRLPSHGAFISAVEQLAGVERAGAATFRPVDDYDGMLVSPDNNKNSRSLVNFSRVDHNYLQVLRYEFVSGRNFSRDYPTDSTAMIINERAAALLFGNEDPVGKKLFDEVSYDVIGVVKDFNFESLRNEVRPLIFLLDENERFMHIRIEPGNYSETLAAIGNEWKKQAPDVPFTYTFLDERYDELYKHESQLGVIFNLFTGLALTIACLGLIGLAAYTAEQRKKEISVRKVLGASMKNLVRILSADFVRIILIAFVISVPISWYLMDQWLSDFAFRTNVPAFTLLFGGVLVVAIALASVSYQAIRAALVNPVETLKEE